METRTVKPAAPAAIEPLAAWLHSLGADPRPRVLLGGSGHLDLSPAEEKRVARALEAEALPALAAAASDAEIVVVTGLAPGADLLFAEVACAWLARAGRPYQRVGLLPVPADVLWTDAAARSGAQAAARVAALRERFEHGLRTCDHVVRLWNGGPEPKWDELAVRQHQYRRLGACLAEQCDLLVAIVRSGHAGQPGGTGEVMAWREHAAGVPAELSTGLRRHRSGWPGADRLIVLDPGAPSSPTAQEASWARQAREALRAGNYLQCYDVLAAAEQQGHFSDELRYLQLLALANAGSTETALRRLAEAPDALRSQNEDWLALEGRLHKDLALRGGPEGPQRFLRAADCYHAAFRKTGGYFSAINAATTALLGGDAGRARQLAAGVLSQIGRFAPSSETDHYYLCATEAEAALLLGDLPRARDALQRADALLRDNLNARSRTLQQLRLICRAGAIDETVLERLHVPPVVFLSADHAGPVPEASFAYAGITEPRELAAAERALERRVPLHVVLAAPRDKMLAHWEAAHGSDWTLRLGRLLEQAQETSVALGFLASEDRWCDAYVGAFALGLSRLAARRLGCAWRGEGTAASGAASVGGAPLEGPHAVTFGRRFAGVIFADFAGFSRLSDDDLPAFWAHFMRAISQRLAARRPQVLLQRTWGDALHVVTENAETAAAIACEIQDCLEHLRPSLPGALSRLELRLSAHYAPVFAGPDPIDDADTYFGTQLSFTARIEPITPPGMIFVTEAFAARIALEAPEAYAFEYAGEVKLAKAYGQSRLFSLRRTIAAA
jgi:hypothetical protein